MTLIKTDYNVFGDRLEKLIEKRINSKNGIDKIDKTIWDNFGDKCCIMFIDLSGFTKKSFEFDIINFMQIIFETKNMLIPIIEVFGGHLLKVEGDSFLVVFSNPDDAVRASIMFQKKIKICNSYKLDKEKILLGIGIGYGEVLKIDNYDILGVEVNWASKLGEDTAKPWEILITNAVKENLSSYHNISFKEISEVPDGAEKAYKIVYEI